MIWVILLIVLAVATGIGGALIKGAFWLFVLTALFLIGAYTMGRTSRSA